MRDGSVLTLWVIYYGASNHPAGKWVVRPQSIENGRVRPHEVFHECDSLIEARAKVPEGLHNLGRYAEDDPVIVETWV
jgi:hypothetical protein